MASQRNEHKARMKRVDEVVERGEFGPEARGLVCCHVFAKLCLSINHNADGQKKLIHTRTI